MNISMETFSSLSYEEIYFVFMMLRKYGGLSNPLPLDNQRSNSKRRKSSSKRKKYIPNGHPNLFDFECSSWDGCNDKKFLLYKSIIESVNL